MVPGQVCASPVERERAAMRSLSPVTAADCSARMASPSLWVRRAWQTEAAAKVRDFERTCVCVCVCVFVEMHTHT